MCKYARKYIKNFPTVITTMYPPLRSENKNITQQHPLVHHQFQLPQTHCKSYLVFVPHILFFVCFKLYINGIMQDDFFYLPILLNIACQFIHIVSGAVTFITSLHFIVFHCVNTPQFTRSLLKGIWVISSLENYKWSCYETLVLSSRAPQVHHTHKNAYLLNICRWHLF